MKKLTCLTLAILATLTVSFQASADKGSNTGSFAFEPIAESANSADWEATAPWIIPEGFSQPIVSDETTLNIYGEGEDGENLALRDNNTLPYLHVLSRYGE